MIAIIRWLEGDSHRPRSFPDILRFVLWALALNLIWLFPATLLRIYFELNIPKQNLDFSNRAIFFCNVVILAPLIEEIIFRFFPIVFVSEIFSNIELREYHMSQDRNLILKKRKLFFFIALGLASSVIFGLAHGSFANLFFQGVGGVFLWVTFVYCSSFGRHIERGYIGSVMLHAFFNFSVCLMYFLGF